MSLSIAGYLTVIGITCAILAIFAMSNKKCLYEKLPWAPPDTFEFLLFCGLILSLISTICTIVESVSDFNGFETMLCIENATDAPLKLTVIKNRPFMNLYVSHEIVKPGETCIIHHAKHVSTRPLKDNDVAKESDIGAAYKKAISDDK